MTQERKAKYSDDRMGKGFRRGVGSSSSSCLCLVSNHGSGSHTHYFSFNESVLMYVIFIIIVGFCVFLEMPSSR